MKKKLFLSLVTYLVAPTIVLAAPVAPGAPIGPGGPGGPGAFSCNGFLSCISTITDPTKGAFGTGGGLPARIINVFLPVVLVIAGFIAVIIVIISGIQFITSGGNPEAANTARSRLIYALIGFGLIILAFAILQIVNTIFLGKTGLV